MQYTTDDFKVFKDYFYVVNMVNLRRPELFPVYFINRNAAKRTLKKTSKYGQVAKYSIMKGREVEKLKLKYLLLLGKMPKHTKHDYPKDCITRPQRHAYRKNIQRRLKRMGLQTYVKSKGRLNEPAQIIKLIRYKPTKKQKERFDCPTTQAKVIRLERKGTKNYYYLLSHKVSERRGILREARALRYNGLNGEYKIINLLIYKKDVIIPYLIREFVQMLKNSKHGKNCLDHFRATHTKNLKGRQKEFLQEDPK